MVFWADGPALFTLVRIAVAPTGAFGVLLHNAAPGIVTPFAVTLEHTYEQPAEPVVKIPPGKHRCVPSYFNHGKYQTYEVLIIGHTQIKFHKGNVEDDSAGCILVAESFAQFNSQPGIAQSAAGFAEFMQRAGSVQGFWLEVRAA